MLSVVLYGVFYLFKKPLWLKKKKKKEKCIFLKFLHILYQYGVGGELRSGCFNVFAAEHPEGEYVNALLPAGRWVIMGTAPASPAGSLAHLHRSLCLNNLPSHGSHTHSLSQLHFLNKKKVTAIRN